MKRLDPQTSTDLVAVRSTLRSLRRRQRLTQTQIARRLGIEQSNVSRVEVGGVNNVRVVTLGRLATVLGGRLRLSVEVARTGKGRR